MSDAIDIWQVMGSLAALAFTVGFVDQLRMTFKTRNVDGLSVLQWVAFAAASATFTILCTSGSMGDGGCFDIRYIMLSVDVNDDF